MTDYIGWAVLAFFMADIVASLYIWKQIEEEQKRSKQILEASKTVSQKVQPYLGQIVDTKKRVEKLEKQLEKIKNDRR